MALKRSTWLRFGSNVNWWLCVVLAILLCGAIVLTSLHWTSAVSGTIVPHNTVKFKSLDDTINSEFNNEVHSFVENGHEQKKHDLTPNNYTGGKYPSPPRESENSQASVDTDEGLTGFELQCKQRVLKAQEKALNTLDSPTGWYQTVGNSKETDGLIFSKKTEWGTVFKLEAILNINVDKLYDDMIHNSERVPTWNPTLVKLKILKPLDDSTEISYSISAPAAGGLISSRDFVYARHWETVDGWLVSSLVSVDYPAMPVNGAYVRGEQKPTVLRMRSAGDQKAELQWLLNTDIKGWIPTATVNQALSGAIVQYLKSLKRHIADIV